MSKNDLVEINQLKSRKEFETFWKISERKIRVETVLNELSKVNDTAKQELFKFIPVSLVATFESMLRSTVKKLIDEKESCFENSKGILADGKLKIEFDYFKGLHKKEFTFGEFISHQISCSRIESFDQALSILLFGEKSKFFKELKEFSPKSIYTDICLKSEEFKANYDVIMSSMTKVFELRHIVCHEMSNELNITEQEIIAFYRNAFLFLNQVYQYLMDVLYPNSPETNEEMFELAAKGFREKENELNNLLEEIKSGIETFEGLNPNIELIQQAQDHWKEFRRLYTEALFYEMRDRGDYKGLYFEELADITDNRIIDLQYDFKFVKNKSDK